MARAMRETFIAQRCPVGADGQVRRAAGRFALVAAAGELARHFGVVPWPQGEAEGAAARCFADWLKARGGSGAAEITTALRQVRLFLEQHGSSRFEPAWIKDDARPSAGDEAEDNLRRTINRAGFRRADSLDDQQKGAWTYYVMPECWASEVCKGFDHKAVASALAERSWLNTGDGRNLTQSVRVPTVGKPPALRDPADLSVRGGRLDADHRLAQRRGRVVRRLSRQRHVLSGQENPNNMRDVPTVPTVPTQHTSIAAALNPASPNIRASGEPARQFTAGHPNRVGTVGTCRDSQVPERLVGVPTTLKAVGTVGTAGYLRPCRHCGQPVTVEHYQHPGGSLALPFADGTAAHLACDDQVYLDRILAAAARAVAPGLERDEAEITLRGEMR